MLFKSLFEKLQPNPKAKNNWLMPFRNSGVKVNLKSVNFDRSKRNGETRPRNTEFFNAPRRPVILPNIQKVDSFLDTPVSLSSILQKETMFAKIHNDKKRNTRWGTPILILLILGFVAAGLYLFSLNKIKDKQNIVDECNRFVMNQKTKGFVSGSTCDPNLSWFDYPFADARANTQFDSIKKSIDKQINDQKIQINNLDKDIRTTKQNLANISPNFEKETPELANNVANTVTDKQNLLNTLKNTLVQKDLLIITLTSQFAYLIKVSPEVDSQKEQTQIKNFEGLSKSEKYVQHKDLSDMFNRFKQNIISVKSADWYTKSLESGNFYSYKILFADEFKNLIDGTKFLDTVSPSDTFISITGDDGADKHIIDIAEKRGYKKRPLAVESALANLGSGNKLQPKAKDALDKMSDAASQDGISLGLISGYRSPNEQQNLFLSRFKAESINSNGRQFTNAEILAGKADEAINKVLSTSSIPGYSRHHTGYTVDINDFNAKKDFTLFDKTEGYAWISANNYYNAKRFGFVPSYPPGASNQGPEPESWEYTYVGVESVK